MMQPASSYMGRHAELYDFFYADKPYAQEARFVGDCIVKYGLRKNNPHVLELACGTGSHSFELEKIGCKIIATDYSSDMLTQARAKAQRMRSEVDFRHQDMRELDVPERPFDAIVCLFDSLGYVATNENIFRVLRNVYAHLKPGGVFIFEFWHAGAMIRSYDPLRVRRWNVANNEIVRISETRIDYRTQLCYVTFKVSELNENGTYQNFSETQINRFFLTQEVTFFLERSGLKPLKFFSGFQNDEYIHEETWHIVAVASRADE